MLCGRVAVALAPFGSHRHSELRVSRSLRAASGVSPDLHGLGVGEPSAARGEGAGAGENASTRAAGVARGMWASSDARATRAGRCDRERVLGARIQSREERCMIFPDDVFDLASVVRDIAQRDPERIAVIEPAGRAADGRRRYERHTYRSLSDDAESVAIGLREMGIVERTRTVFMAPPSYEACVVCLALTRVGATIVMIDPSVGYRNVGERLRRVRPEAFVGIPIAHLARIIFGWGPR